MFLGTYRFEGDPDILKQGYDRMIETVPHANLHLHLCVPDEQGLTIYDTCPTRDVFMQFSGSDDFRELLNSLAMPAPTITPLGEIHSAFVSGNRIV